MAICFLVGGMFLLVGLAGIVFPPKSINKLYGYRTTRSMKTPENWKFANWISMRLVAAGGLVMIALGWQLPWETWAELIGVGVSMGIMLGTIIGMFWFTEYQLQNKESEDR